MRNVRFNRYIKAEYMQNVNVPIRGTGLVEEGYTNEGIFLGWGIDWTNLRSGAVNFTVALVELEDGTVERVEVDRIKFYNPREELGRYTGFSGHKSITADILAEKLTERLGIKAAYDHVVKALCDLNTEYNVTLYMEVECLLKSKLK